MGKQRKKTIVAGPLVYEAIYPITNPRDSRSARAAKKRLSSEAQERMNRKAQWQKLELLMAANFGERDLVVTLTFDDAHLPDSRSGTRQKVKDFFKALRQRRKPLGKETKYIYVIEHNHSREDPCFTPVELAQQGRWHIHMILNGTGADLDDIRESWPFGLFEAHGFELTRDRTYESLARYFCKECTDKPGDRKFIPSRGLKQPEVDSQIIDSKDDLKPPKGSVVYEDTGLVTTVYGKKHFVKYLWPQLVQKAPKARRRKRTHRRNRTF